MAENRVVIKINYDTEKRKEVIDPKLVTVWHTQRIVGALSILIFIAGLLIWLFNGNEETAPDDNPLKATVVTTDTPAPLAEIHAQPTILPTPATSKQLALYKGDAVILDKHVIRASLNTAMKDNEPGQLLLHKFDVPAGKPQELFYFSETREGIGEVLFHQWTKDGRSIQKKQVEKRKSKFVSKHTLSQKDTGHWQVQLIDKKGKIYSQTSFDVVNQ